MHVYDWIKHIKVCSEFGKWFVDLDHGYRFISEGCETKIYWQFEGSKINLDHPFLFVRQMGLKKLTEDYWK